MELEAQVKDLTALIKASVGKLTEPFVYTGTGEVGTDTREMARSWRPVITATASTRRTVAQGSSPVDVERSKGPEKMEVSPPVAPVEVPKKKEKIVGIEISRHLIDPVIDLVNACFEEERSEMVEADYRDGVMLPSGEIVEVGERYSGTSFRLPAWCLPSSEKARRPKLSSNNELMLLVALAEIRAVAMASPQWTSAAADTGWSQSSYWSGPRSSRWYG